MNSDEGVAMVLRAVFIVGLFGWSLIGCKTISNNSQINNGEDSQDASEYQTEYKGVDDEQVSLEEVLEEGFCYDDVYATYLKNKYVHEISKSRKSPKNKTQRKRIENESLFHARSRLIGPMPSIFGSLPVVANDSVEFWIRYFQTQGRSTFTKWLVRAESFRDVLEYHLRQEGLPTDLFFLAMVESGFNNTASSSKKATGTWQFMKGTAKLYELQINYWIDERKDPVKSTVAAARFLKDLYTRFGDWYLAMAAYNAGPGKIQRAMKKTKSKDFWTIAQTSHIRNETKQYVPKILAALTLASNPKKYGYDVQKNLRDTIPTTTVELDRPIKISELANHLNYPLDAIKKWNPEIMRDITPPLKNGAKYALRLSSSLIDPYHSIKDNLSEIKITDVQMYRIKKGDTLSQIARSHRVSISQIMELNPGLKARQLRLGREIAIPVPGVVTVKQKSVNKSA